MRAARSARTQLTTMLVSSALITLVGLLLGAIASTITVTEIEIWSFKSGKVDDAMWRCDGADETDETKSCDDG
eukprot:5394355-Pleurochrysis_carterae.AAC.1